MSPAAWGGRIAGVPARAGEEVIANPMLGLAEPFIGQLGDLKDLGCIGKINPRVMGAKVEAVLNPGTAPAKPASASPDRR